MAKQGEHGISWTEETWNPIRGCSRVSAGCQNCYAERIAARFNHPGEPYEGLAAYAGTRIKVAHWTGEVRFIEEHLEDPIRWQRPRMIFVNSMSDLFHEKVPDNWIDAIFAVMALAPRHIFQCLTKRPERMVSYLNSIARKAHVEKVAGELTYDVGGTHVPIKDWPLPNVWLGVSVEDQKTSDERVPLLLETPAAVRWVSYEPALGPVDFREIVMPDGDHLDTFYNDGTESGISWVVCGGESGPNARPMCPEWARRVRDQCVVAGVPFHFKQWGEFLPKWTTGAIEGWENEMQRVGKRAAGRLLDGKEWNQFPIL